jgi:hypothetical protein
MGADSEKMGGVGGGTEMASRETSAGSASEVGTVDVSALGMGGVAGSEMFGAVTTSTSGGSGRMSGGVSGCTFGGVSGCASGDMSISVARVVGYTFVMQLRLDTTRNTARSPITGREYRKDYRDSLPVDEKMKALLEVNVDFQGSVEDIFTDADKIQGANCHKTALFLTGEIGWNELFDATNHDVDEAGHVHVLEHTNIFRKKGDVDVQMQIVERHIQKRPLPVRLTLFERVNETQYFPKHSVTITGIVPGGIWNGFEKVDAHANDPFQKVNAYIEVLNYLVEDNHYVGIEKVV